MEQVPRDKKNMFRAGLYTIIAATELYTKHLKIYNHFLECGLDNPTAIIRAQKPSCIACALDELTSKMRFPNEKRKRVVGYAKWWQKSDLPNRIIKDVHNGRKKEFELRNEFAKECPGMALKGASLLFEKLGYNNVVPVDIWVLRWLKDNGHKVPIPDYKTVSGIQDYKYLEAEKIFIEKAKEYRNLYKDKVKVTPAVFQFALWSKYAPWNPTLQMYDKDCIAAPRKLRLPARELALRVKNDFETYSDRPDRITPRQAELKAAAKPVIKKIVTLECYVE